MLSGARESVHRERGFEWLLSMLVNFGCSVRIDNPARRGSAMEWV
jgi:hypothetical protein